MSIPLQAGMDSGVKPESGEVTPAMEAKADDLISRYPVSKRSAVLPLLHLWQETFGYIGPRGVEWIAKKLTLQEIQSLGTGNLLPLVPAEALWEVPFSCLPDFTVCVGGCGKDICHTAKVDES